MNHPITDKHREVAKEIRDYKNEMTEQDIAQCIANNFPEKDLSSDAQVSGGAHVIIKCDGCGRCWTQKENGLFCEVTSEPQPTKEVLSEAELPTIEEVRKAIADARPGHWAGMEVPPCGVALRVDESQILPIEQETSIERLRQLARDFRDEYAYAFKEIGRLRDIEDVLTRALPYVECSENDAGYKKGAVAKMVKEIRTALAKASPQPAMPSETKPAAQQPQEEKCKDCDGLGKVLRKVSRHYDIHEWGKCFACHGTGLAKKEEGE